MEEKNEDKKERYKEWKENDGWRNKKQTVEAKKINKTIIKVKKTKHLN